jgi:hypothetical protein
MKEQQPLSPYSILLIPGVSAHLNKLLLVVPLLFVILGGLLAAR